MRYVIGSEAGQVNGMRWLSAPRIAAGHLRELVLPGPARACHQPYDPGRASWLRSVSTVNGEFFIPALPGQTPSAEGYFGAFGGKFIPEALVAAGG